VNSISHDELAMWIAYIRTVCGIALDNTKAYLIESRLKPLGQETGCSTWSELYRKVRADVSMSLQRKVIDGITTRETSFFRDTSPFELLQNKILPDLIDARRKNNREKTGMQMKIWSAACSTGQEVYSVAIVIKELLGSLNGYDIRILGTDISGQAIAQASSGKYSRLDMERGMPNNKADRYFMGKDDMMQIRDEIRAMTTFKNLNLLEPFTFPQKYDIILCRNVAIYFSEADRKKLFDRITSVLSPDGYLIIGSTESLLGLCPQLESHRYLRSIYYKFK
jgi:chemotaxis protein methyltransferase CheR